VLSVLDRKWREHLYEMDYLQEGIALRSYGQRDPLVEYQREGFDLFQAMLDAIKEESVGFLFNVEVQVEPEVPAGPDEEAEAPGQLGGYEHVAVLAPGLGPARPAQLEYTAPTVDGEGGVVHTATGEAETPAEFGRVARNELCPCGSGRKYKRCHGDPRRRPA
jgi:preprotein translocase subunit SecA